MTRRIATLNALMRSLTRPRYDQTIFALTPNAAIILTQLNVPAAGEEL